MAHKIQPETIDLAEINNLSADKRALLARRLRKSKPLSAEQRKPASTRQRITTLSTGLAKQFLAFIERQDECIPEAEILAWFAKVDEELATLQKMVENGQISEDEWINIRVSLIKGIKMLIDRYRQSPAIQHRCQSFITEHDLVYKLLDHPTYKFTLDLFTQHIEQWKKDLGFFKGLPNLRFLEIGSFEGRSTCWLLENILTHETSTIICVDPFCEIDQPRQEKYFDFNVNQTGMSYKVTKLRGKSQAILGFLSPATFDFIYIDGSHEAGDILQDAILAWEVLKRHGILVFDDYEYILPFSMFNSTILQPKQAIDAFLSLISDRSLIVHKGSQLTLRKLY